MTKHVCMRCAIRLDVTVRQLIGYVIRPFTPPTLCWCRSNLAAWWQA